MKESLSTFVTNTGTPDDRVFAATGLPGTAALLDRMAGRGNTVARDLLVPSACNENCRACFFTEGEGGCTRLTADAMGEIRLMALALGREFPELFTPYPREITTAPEMLSVFSEFGVKRTLTNGKLLGKPGVMDRLWTAGIRSLVVTVPGGAESFAWYTGENASSYDPLISTIGDAVRRGFDVGTFMPVFRDNVDDIGAMSQRLSQAGVRDIMCIRVVPVGRAAEWDDNLFLDRDSAVRFFGNVNAARLALGDRTRITMFGGSFGPNFSGREIFRYLSGDKPRWPGSKYLCPLVTGQFVGVSFASKRAYPCFQMMSFPETAIGTYADGTVEITAPLPPEEAYRERLRGICAADDCTWQALCMGGCRSAAFSFARRRGEADPIFAGQDICQTRIIEEETGG
jgi:radical SAM protein with 4Fe4S-binding SPASM domain